MNSIPQDLVSLCFAFMTILLSFEDSIELLSFPSSFVIFFCVYFYFFVFVFIFLFLLFFLILLFLYLFGRQHWSSYMGNTNLL